LESNEQVWGLSSNDLIPGPDLIGDVELIANTSAMRTALHGASGVGGDGTDVCGRETEATLICCGPEQGGAFFSADLFHEQASNDLAQLSEGFAVVLNEVRDVEDRFSHQAVSTVR
jgi:hypothetical protein